MFAQTEEKQNGSLAIFNIHYYTKFSWHVNFANFAIWKKSQN